jgi:hypothetical protein
MPEDVTDCTTCGKQSGPMKAAQQESAVILWQPQREVMLPVAAGGGEDAQGGAVPQPDGP